MPLDDLTMSSPEPGKKIKKASYKKTAKDQIILNPVLGDKDNKLMGENAPAKHINSLFKESFSSSLDEKVKDSLVKKAEFNEIPFEIVVEVYKRGISDYLLVLPEGKTPEQWAFARVNSFTSGGKAFSLDSDLINENLRQWFQDKWVRMDTKGNIKGPCARKKGEGKPKCLPSAKAHALSKVERAAAAIRKRREDPNPERSGSAINVRTEEKDACYSKVKSRYKIWPSAYASGALSKCRKVGAKNWGNKTEETNMNINELFSQTFNQENINELSSETHASYAKKAASEIQALKPHAKNGEYKDLAANLIKKRVAGLSKIRLDDKGKPMAEEVEQLEEATIHMPVYDKYITDVRKKKGGGSITYNEVAQHHGTEALPGIIKHLTKERDDLMTKHRTTKVGMLHDFAIKGFKSVLKNSKAQQNEENQLDEISAKTKLSYVAKAASSTHEPKDGESQSQYLERLHKRMSGIKKALKSTNPTQRFQKEEVKIPDETTNKLRKITKQLDKSVKTHHKQSEALKKLVSQDKKDVTERKNCGCGQDPCITYGTGSSD